MVKIYHFILFVIQYCFYYLIFPIAYLLHGNKYPWIICERGDDARDNGYTMFKYLRNEQQYINVYYLINKKSADYPKVKALGKVVKYKSFKHWLLYRVAECRMSTHLASFAPGNYIGEWFKHHKQKGINVFLQHGITHNEFPSNYYEYNGSDLFICGAKLEYDHISKNCHYPEGNVVYTGFSRFDELHDFETKNQILVMPSWRNYLQGTSEEEFKESKYFKTYDSLLRNRELNEKLEKEGIKLVFYIHYSLQQYSDCFTNYGPNVIIADFDHYDVQTLLKESKLLITDYSSVFFDFAYMRKPLIYYQFDIDEFYGKHYKQSYFNHNENGFGPVINSHNYLIKSIIHYTKNDFVIEKMYEERIDHFFPLYDTINSKRLFESILYKLINTHKYGAKAKNATYLTFTGDDYGRNKESVNGINEAYKKGLIQQTSLMVNRNEADMIGIEYIPNDRVTFHFNILEGNKMYDPNGEWYYFIEEDGIAKRLGARNTFFCIKKEYKTIVKEELQNQIKRYKELNYQCNSFDSHGHMHNRWPIARLLVPICKDAGFKVARIPSNIKHTHLLFDLTYKKIVTHLYRKHFITTDYFCSCYSLIHLNLNKYSGKTIEVMTHPFMFDYGLDNRRDISFELLQKYISKFNIKLINYNDLIKMKEKKNG